MEGMCLRSIVFWHLNQAKERKVLEIFFTHDFLYFFFFHLLSNYTSRRFFSLSCSRSLFFSLPTKQHTTCYICCFSFVIDGFAFLRLHSKILFQFFFCVVGIWWRKVQRRLLIFTVCNSKHENMIWFHV